VRAAVGLPIIDECSECGAVGQGGFVTATEAESVPRPGHGSSSLAVARLGVSAASQFLRRESESR
jgi:hypothetical protein